MKNKRFALIALMPLLFSCTRVYSSAEHVKEMEVSGDQDFIVLQLTDIHWNYSTNIKEASAYLSNTIKVAKERAGHIDLLEITGDSLLVANKKIATTIYDLIDSWDIPWAFTFGNHDMVIFHRSLEENEDASEVIVKYINKNNIDFSAFLSPYVQDLNGNPLSLANYLKVFGVQFEGRAHDALADAYNLMDLYKAVLEKPNVLIEEYAKTLTHYHHAPLPVAKIIKKLTEGESVTPEDWDIAIAETFK